MRKVTYLGCTKEQHSWGNHTGSPNDLEVGTVYEIERTEVHSWHTKIYLKGITGSFNSVYFKEAHDE